MKSFGFFVLWLVGSVVAVSVAFAGVAVVDDDLINPAPASRALAQTELDRALVSATAERPTNDPGDHDATSTDLEATPSDPDTGGIGDKSDGSASDDDVGRRSPSPDVTPSVEPAPTPAISPAPSDAESTPAPPTPNADESSGAAAAGATSTLAPTTQPQPPSAVTTATTAAPTATEVPPRAAPPTPVPPTPVPPTPVPPTPVPPTPTPVPPTPVPVPPTPVPPTPVPPTPVPPTPTTEPTQVLTFNLIGGSTSIRFSPTLVEVLWATPNPGFDVEIEPGDDDTRVDFESDGHESRIDAWWDDGPRHEIREDEE